MCFLCICLFVLHSLVFVLLLFLLLSGLAAVSDCGTPWTFLLTFVYGKTPENWAGDFLSVAWPTGVQLLVFFCSSVPVVLFDTPGISRCRSQHVSVESSSLLHHSIYL